MFPRPDGTAKTVKQMGESKEAAIPLHHLQGIETAEWACLLESQDESLQ